MLADEFSLPHMSIVRNMSDKNAEKSRSRRVGRCLGFSVIAPVEGSIIICCNAEDVEETTIPLVDPGAAMYGSLFAFGDPSRMVRFRRLGLNR